MKKTALSIILLLTISVLSTGCGEQSEEDHESHPMEHEEENPTIVHLDRHKVFHAGIRVEPVKKKSLPVPLMLPGKIEFNERKFAAVTARLGGRVEKLHHFVNDRVNENDVLLEVFSQEHQALQFDLLQARARTTTPGQGPNPDSAEALSIYASVRKKLTIA